MQIHPKVAASTNASLALSASVVVAVWLLKQSYGIQIPSDVAAAIVTIVGTLGTFIAGYLTPSSKDVQP